MPVRVPLKHPRLGQIYETDIVSGVSRAYHNEKPARGRVVAPVERSAAWVAAVRKPGCVMSARPITASANALTCYFEIPIVPFTALVRFTFRAALTDGGACTYQINTDLGSTSAIALADTAGLSHDLALPYQHDLDAGDGDGSDGGVLGGNVVFTPSSGSARIYSIGWQLLPMTGEVQA